MNFYVLQNYDSPASDKAILSNSDWSVYDSF